MSKWNDAVFAAIVEYKRQNDGNSPTLQNIMDVTGITSKSVASTALRKLQDAGKIYVNDTSARMIFVVGGQWKFEKDS